MKKFMTVLFTAGIACTLVGCSTNNDPQIVGQDSATWGPDIEADDNVEIPNPITEYRTKEEAEDKAGFLIDAPVTLDGYETTYLVYELDGTYMIDVRYENENDSISIRKQVGTGNDISGVYTEYNNTDIIILNDLEVTTKGNNGTISVATWTDGTYDYAIYSEVGISAELLNTLISQIS